MAYFDQKRKSVVSQNLQPILKRYRVKGTLSVRNHSTVVLTLKSGPIDFIGEFNTVSRDRRPSRPSSVTGNMDINEFWYQEQFPERTATFLGEVFTALRSANWYDNSDASIDYFNTAYYIDVKIGRYNAPYLLTA